MVTRDVDLNLLRALQAILDEQSVTKAAAQLGLSQPAMSASLAKLRRHFNDDLLVRVGNAYESTPLARQLLEPASAALRAVNNVFIWDSVFDPSTTTREFSVVMSDYAASVLGPPISRRLNERAPNARLVIRSMRPEIVDQAPESMRNYDLIVMPHGFLQDLHSRDIYEEEWVCVLGSQADVEQSLTVADLGRLPWVLTWNQRQAFTTAVQQLRISGVEPQVSVVTEGYLVVGPILEGTDRIAVVQNRLAHWLAAAHHLRIMQCPLELAPLIEAMWWHPIHHDDPAHIWFRELFREAGIEVQ